MSLAVVQAAAAETVSNSSALPTFGSNVTNGNLLVAMMFGREGAEEPTFPTAGLENGWSYAGVSNNATGSSNNANVAVYTRTALTADGKTPPGISSNTNGFANAVMMWEISGGASATFDADAVGDNISASGGTSGTATSVSGTLALAAVGAVFEIPTVSAGGWGASDASAGSSVGCTGYHQTASPSTGYSLTTNATGFGPAAYAIVILKAGSSGESGAITQTLGATFSQTLVGDIPNNFGPIAQTFGRFSQSVGGNDSTPGKGAVYFTTFGG